MRVCPACGIIAPTELQSCAGCGVVISQLPEASASGSVDAMWVRVECTYKCPSCGADSPLDHLELEPKVECSKCGQIRNLDASSWGAVVRLAHDVADLGRPVHASTTLGAYNHYAFLAVKVPFAVAEGNVAEPSVASPVTVSRVRAAPGHPPCPSCHAPLNANASGGGHLATQCSRCGESAMYSVRPGLYTPLQAVLADEQRVDRPAAKMESTMWAGPITLRCASCNTQLQPIAGQPQLPCSYCRTICRIPDRARRRVYNDITARPWWMLFGNRSPTRDALEGIAALLDERNEPSANWRAVLGGQAIGRGMVGLLLGFVSMIAGAAATAITWEGVPTEPEDWAIFAVCGVLLPLLGLLGVILGLRSLLGWRALARTGEVIAIEIRKTDGRGVTFAHAGKANEERRATAFKEQAIPRGKRWIAAVDRSSRMHLLEPVEWFELPMRVLR